MTFKRSCRSARIAVYDPDGINPYGRELASLLGTRRDVLLFTPRKLHWAPSGLPVAPVLASSVPQDGLMVSVVRRIVGPLTTVIRCLRERRCLIVVWVRGAWDGILFRVARKAGLRIVVIDHNPLPERARGGLVGAAEQLLMAVADVRVVHDEKLLHARPCRPNTTVVVSHPSYKRWAATFAPHRRHPKGRALLFLGALRKDKGVGDFVDVITALERDVDAVLAGRGQLTPEQRAKLTKAGTPYEVRGGDVFLDDHAVAGAIGDAALMLAPYTGATQSGSVILALTCDLPVLGYAAGALPSLLNTRSVVPSGDPAALASLARQWLDTPWSTFVVTADELDLNCLAGWESLLAAVAEE